MAAKLARRPEQTCCSIEHSEVVENYLKALFHLCTRTGRATTSALAVQL